MFLFTNHELLNLDGNHIVITAKGNLYYLDLCSSNMDFLFHIDYFTSYEQAAEVLVKFANKIQQLKTQNKYVILYNNLKELE